MSNKCGNCGKDSGKYKFCIRCNERYKKEQLRTDLVMHLKNINQNLGHLVALKAKQYPELEKELQEEWGKNKEEKEQEEEEREKLDEEQEED